MEMPTEMQHQVMGYDRGTALFSPDGHLLQVEYAEKTVRLGSASIGVICSDGVVIVSDKRVKEELLVRESATKVYEIDSHIAASAAGILSDARVLLERAQLISQQHRITYDESIDVESVIKEIANVKQAFTQYGGARPFGVSIMIAGINNDESRKLFVSDITGNYLGYKAAAIGENDEKIKEMLRREYRENINTEQGIKLALNIFKNILKKDFDIGKFDAGIIKTADRKILRLSGDELKKYMKS